MNLVELENGAKEWTFRPSQYIQEAVQNVESYFKERELKLPARARAPIRKNYCPGIDETADLEPVDAAYYQTLIGILWWTVKLGRVNICTEFFLLSSYLDLL